MDASYVIVCLIILLGSIVYIIMKENNFRPGKEICIPKDEEGLLNEMSLTDQLLAYTGNHEELMGELWEKFEELPVRTQVSVLDYFRFKSGDFCEKIFPVMMDCEKDKELRLSAIRYFGRYRYGPALKPLLEFASDQNPFHWEYAAAGVYALTRYRKEDTLKVITETLHNPNWYVRCNASAALGAYQLNQDELRAVVKYYHSSTVNVTVHSPANHPADWQGGCTLRPE